MQETLLLGDLTRVIIASAMKVHSHFGPGFREVIYERSLYHELRNCGIECKCQVSRDVKYFEHHVGSKRLDMIIEGKVLVELKTLPDLDRASIQQAVNYLKVFGLEVGLILNFGRQSLQVKRIIYNNSVKSLPNP
jgi:GxxExxY protein